MNKVTFWTMVILVVLAIGSVWLWVNWPTSSASIQGDSATAQKEAQTMSVEQMALKSLQAPDASPVENNEVILAQLSVTFPVDAKSNKDASTSAATLSSLTPQN